MPDVPTRADLERGKLDLLAVKATVEGAEGAQVTTPEGGVVDTLRTAIATIKALNDRGPWAQDTVYAMKDLVRDPDDLTGPVYVRTEAGTSPASGTFQDEYDNGNGPWRVHATAGIDETVATYSDEVLEGSAFDLLNTHADFKKIALAIRAGAAKVVFIGDSLTFGSEAPAENSYPARFARWLRFMFPACTFTFINRAIPGSTSNNFIDTGYHPNAAAGVGAGLPGHDAWSPEAREEHDFRWPEGASSFAGAWRAVIAADDPDLVVMGWGYNDLNIGGQTLKGLRNNWITIAGLFLGVEPYPSIVLFSEHSGSASNTSLDAWERNQHHGSARLMRIIARAYRWGMIDASRWFDRVMHGFDPLKLQVKIERWMDGWGDSSKWLDYTSNGVNAHTSDPVTGEGTSGVVLDSTGKHAGINATYLLRKVYAEDVSVRFNLRKLATANDALLVLLNCRETSPDTETRKIYVAFSNTGAGGVGKIDIVQDTVQLATHQIAAPFPSNGIDDFYVIVSYHQGDIRVWVQGDTDPNVPTVELKGYIAGPSYFGFVYFNLVGAPAVKLSHIVMEHAVAARVAATKLASEDEFWGVTFGGYATEASPLGGDTINHPSILSAPLWYDPAMWPVIENIARKVRTLGTFGGGTKWPLEWADEAGDIQGGIASFEGTSQFQAFGARYDETIPGWIATNAVAVIIGKNDTGDGDFEVYANEGLTPGDAFAPTLRFAVNADGRMYAKGIHNNAGAVTGTSNQYIASGTYTPTLTNTLNVAASTARKCQWMRVGNVVTVSGMMDIDPTAGSTLTQLDFTLPIATNIGSFWDVAGAAACAILNVVGAVYGVAASDKARIQYVADSGAGNQSWTFSFTYEVL